MCRILIFKNAVNIYNNFRSFVYNVMIIYDRPSYRALPALFVKQRPKRERFHANEQRAN